MFLVQRVAIIPASRAAAIFFFSTFFSPLVGKYCPFLFFYFFYFFAKVINKSLHLHLFDSHGRYTGNIIISMDSPRIAYEANTKNNCVQVSSPEN